MSVEAEVAAVVVAMMVAEVAAAICKVPGFRTVKGAAYESDLRDKQHGRI